MNRNLPTMSREERAAEYQEMARDCIRMGRMDLAWGATRVADQILRQPSNLAEALADVLAKAVQ